MADDSEHGRLTRALTQWAAPIVASYPGRLRGFAAASGISKSKLNRMLNLENPWTAEDIERFAQAAGLDLYSEAIPQIEVIYNALPADPPLLTVVNGTRQSVPVRRKPALDPFSVDELAAAHHTTNEPGGTYGGDA